MKTSTKKMKNNNHDLDFILSFCEENILFFAIDITENPYFLFHSAKGWVPIKTKAISNKIQ